MIPLALAAISALACAIILLRAEPALNAMTPATPLVVRMALWLLCCGALAQLLSIVMGEVPRWPTVVLELGTGVLLYCERRMRVLVPRPPRARQF